LQSGGIGVTYKKKGRQFSLGDPSNFNGTGSSKPLPEWRHCETQMLHNICHRVVQRHCGAIASRCRLGRMAGKCGSIGKPYGPDVSPNTADIVGQMPGQDWQGRKAKSGPELAGSLASVNEGQAVVAVIPHLALRLKTLALRWCAMPTGEQCHQGREWNERRNSRHRYYSVEVRSAPHLSRSSVDSRQ